MLRTLSIWKRHRDVIEITAAPADSQLAIKRRKARLQLAAEIELQGSAADAAADSARAAIPNTFPPRRPKYPVKDWS